MTCYYWCLHCHDSRDFRIRSDNLNRKDIVVECLKCHNTMIVIKHWKFGFGIKKKGKKVIDL